MDTSPRLHEDEHVPVRRSPAVAAFLAALQQEQERYLSTVQHAVSALRNETGQMPCLAATHGRLTQQLFDAQRLILARRAAADAEVAHVARLTEVDAIALVKAAQRAGVTSGQNATGPARRALAVVESELGASRSPRQEIAALGRTVVQSMADAEALARVIDDAFEPDEPNGAVAQRQLTALLDEWWASENQEGRAAIDDAHARAAMRMHIAKIQAEEALGRQLPTYSVVADAVTAEVPVIMADTLDPERVPPVAAAPLRLLPARMSAVLDTADTTDLDSLLANLSASLDRPRSSPSGVAAVQAGPRSPATVTTIDAPIATSQAPRQVDGLTIRLDQPVIEVANGSEDAFRRFWTKGHTATEAKRSLGWIPLHVVVPMAAAMSAIALLMAWIG